eukprot:scaffold238701_cov26-Prasinocladus_malaysianus.AAC.1
MTLELGSRLPSSAMLAIVCSENTLPSGASPQPSVQEASWWECSFTSRLGEVPGRGWGLAGAEVA